uniref:Uncharacterized protein n=1 Tax=Leersia perrieri TaxID=77586 RepID=A0A0D9X488_9ORYZ
MEEASLNLRFILVLALLLNPASADECIVDAGYVLFCTKAYCNYSCWFEGLIKKGKSHGPLVL